MRRAVGRGLLGVCGSTGGRTAGALVDGAHVPSTRAVRHDPPRGAASRIFSPAQAEPDPGRDRGRPTIRASSRCPGSEPRWRVPRACMAILAKRGYWRPETSDRIPSRCLVHGVLGVRTVTEREASVTYAAHSDRAATYSTVPAS